MFKDALGNIFCFDDFLNELKELPNEEHQLIRHVVTISKLLHVNPATSASGERSVSMARRLKTWLRSKMTQERFNSLAILHSHKCKTDTLNLLDTNLLAMKTGTEILENLSGRTFCRFTKRYFEKFVF